MINLLLGLPGGGKSYEAVVYHILPALKKGRKVITNLPLDLTIIGALHPEYLPLIEIRKKTLKENTFDSINEQSYSFYQKFRFNGRESKHNDFPFSNLEDYGDLWRHPVNGSGPFYVIDECHIALPRVGTPVKVEEWFSMHRHEFADVLLITQTYGKINQAIRDIAQVVYRVKKATAFGFDSKYIRKVQDGLRGEVVNTSIRKYDSKFFKYYTSNTKSGTGTELTPNDIKPIWQNWVFLSFGFLMLLLVFMLLTFDLKHPFKPDLDGNTNSVNVIDSTISNTIETPIIKTTLPDIIPLHSTESIPESIIDDPFLEKGIHMVGFMSMKRNGKIREVWKFAISQNGQHIGYMTDKQLKASGYEFISHSACSGVLVIADRRRPVSCDAPQIQLIAQNLQIEKP